MLTKPTEAREAQEVPRTLSLMRMGLFDQPRRAAIQGITILLMLCLLAGFDGPLEPLTATRILALMTIATAVLACVAWRVEAFRWKNRPIPQWEQIEESDVPLRWSDE